MVYVSDPLQHSIVFFLEMVQLLLYISIYIWTQMTSIFEGRGPGLNKA